MADRRAVTERKHRGHAPAFEGESRVTDGINPTMKAVQAASP
jgi:hypothetical protein